MIGLRIFWALFLGGLVAFAFHRAWRWEHGEPLPEWVREREEPQTKETYIWVDALYLPILLLLLFLIMAAKEGGAGVEKFFYLTLDVMVVITVHFLLLLLLLPLLRKHFSARACATLWILPVFLFWQFSVMLDGVQPPAFVLYIPKPALDVLFCVWWIGFVAVFGWRVIAHAVFRHRVLAASYSVLDEAVTRLFEEELQGLEYYHPVRLVISPAVTAPLSMGIRKRNRVTVLPQREFSREELQLIFRHEIHHLQRGDVGTKIFFAFCQALCWFNPLIWVATAKASDDLELSCDEIVLEERDEGVRRQYASLLLETAGQAGGFSTCLSAAAKTMRYRLKHVVTLRQRRRGTALLFLAMFLFVMSYGTVAVSTERLTLAEIIKGENGTAEVESLYYCGAGERDFKMIDSWDEEGLVSYLMTLEAERFGSANEYDASREGQGIALWIEDPRRMEVIIHERIVVVYYFGSNFRTEYFHLRSDIDWETIEQLLNLSEE